jgi:hypothetical protein
MLSRLPITETLVNKARAARRIAARIASAFIPPRNLAPLTHEALCYGCMVGIVMPARYHIASRESPRDDLDTELNDGPTAAPDINNCGRRSVRSLS